MRIHLVAFATLVILVSSACGGDDGDPITPDADLTGPPDAGTPREVITETIALVPGELAEGIMHGSPDDFAIIHLEAPSSELDWNIHGRAGGETQTVYEELNVMTVDYRFTPSEETDWWLLLRNSGPVQFEVQVRVELHGEMTWAWK